MSAVARSEKSKDAAIEKFSLKAFAQGVLLAATIYLGLFAYVASQRMATVGALEMRLASRVAPVIRAEKPAPTPEMANFPPAPALVRYGAPESPPAPLAAGETPDHPPAVKTEPAAAVTTLQAAPLPGLYEDSPGGMLPKISESGVMPFAAYKRPYTPDGRPVIAIALKDYGLSDIGSEKVLSDLPAAVSFILSPYAPKADEWQKKAREHGHEVWLYLPMENENMAAEDPGPQALLTTAGLSDNQDRLRWLLSRTTGYAGVAGYTDSVFNDMHSMLQSIAKSFFARGLGYLEINPQGSPLIETLSLASNTAFIGNDGDAKFLDAAATRAWEAQSRSNGFVTVVVTLTPRNLQTLSAWIDSLIRQGFSIVPVSAIAALKDSKTQPSEPAPSPGNSAAGEVHEVKPEDVH